MFEQINYDYRPASYWNPQNLRQLIANIKGAERKKRALRLIEAGRLDEAADFVLAESLCDEQRTLAGQEHPALMGGEYLPGYRAGLLTRAAMREGIPFFTTVFNRRLDVYSKNDDRNFY